MAGYKQDPAKLVVVLFLKNVYVINLGSFQFTRQADIHCICSVETIWGTGLEDLGSSCVFGEGGGIGLRFVFVVAGPVNFKSLGCISTDLKLSISTCQFEAHAANP